MGGRHTRIAGAAVDKFGLVLLSCLFTYGIVVSVDSTQWAGLAGSLPVLVTILLTLDASSPGPTVYRLAVGLVSAAIVAGAVAAGHQNTVSFGISMILTGLSLLVCIAAILLRMASHREVTVHTVLAVLSAYVMLGLFFTFLDSGIGHIAGTFFAQSGAHTQSDYAYLSYITLTTVGFGDLTPGTGIARSVIILEALVGQIFLVTLVARMVSLYGTERSPMSLRSKTEPPKDPE